MNIAVLLCNMGGPDSLQNVEEYLFQIFNDPDIIDIPLPGRLRTCVVRWLARKRASESREIYKKLGGRTPLLAISMRQAEKLEEALNAGSGEDRFRVWTAMRYWHPFMEEVWQRLLDESFDRVIVFSLYPFYSTTTTGSIWNEIERLCRKYDYPQEKVLFIDRFGNHPDFIKAVVEQIREYIDNEGVPGPQNLLFSAHSIPLRRIQKGDPYFEEIREAVNLIEKSFPSDHVKFHLAFQSKLGPIKWLSPATPDKIEELASQGIKRLLVYPLGFVADNSETVYEIGMLYADLAREKGIEEFLRIEALNDRTSFIEVMEKIIRQKLAEGELHA